MSTNLEDKKWASVSPSSPTGVIVQGQECSSGTGKELKSPRLACPSSLLSFTPLEESFFVRHPLPLLPIDFTASCGGLSGRGRILYLTQGYLFYFFIFKELEPVRQERLAGSSDVKPWVWIVTVVLCGGWPGSQWRGDRLGGAEPRLPPLEREGYAIRLPGYSELR